MADRITEAVQRFAKAKSPKKQFEELFGIKPGKDGSQEAVYRQLGSLNSAVSNPEAVDGPIKDDMTEKLSRGAVLAQHFGYNLLPPKNKE